MSWVRIWIHLVFSTKNRVPLLKTPEIREAVFTHIAENAKNKDIWIDSIGGHADHVHCLISLKKEQTISKITQLIKGESSLWVNKSNLITTPFKWQKEYWAVSVSESHLNAIRNYIKNQEKHHRYKSFEEEVSDFMEKYGWKFIKNDS